MVNPAFPVKSVPELIAYAKANPGKLNIASAGVGTGPSVACDLFKMMTDTNMVQVPYKASYMSDLLGGQIPMAFAPIIQIIEDVRAGKLIAIGLESPDPLLPEEVEPESLGAAILAAVASVWPGEEMPGLVERWKSERPRMEAQIQDRLPLRVI